MSDELAEKIMKHISETKPDIVEHCEECEKSVCFDYCDKAWDISEFIPDEETYENIIDSFNLKRGCPYEIYHLDNDCYNIVYTSRYI